MFKPKPQWTQPQALGDLCLQYLTEVPEELERFMSVTGYTPAALRAALHSSGLTHALIDYVASNEPLLLTICARRGIKPEEFMGVWAKLNPAG